MTNWSTVAIVAIISNKMSDIQWHIFRKVCFKRKLSAISCVLRSSVPFLQGATSVHLSQLVPVSLKPDHSMSSQQFTSDRDECRTVSFCSQSRLKKAVGMIWTTFSFAKDKPSINSWKTAKCHFKQSNSCKVFWGPIIDSMISLYIYFLDIWIYNI